MNIQDLLEQMLMLVLILGAGVISRKSGIIDGEGNKKISRMILNVSQPAMIVASAVTSELALGALEMLSVFLCGWVMYLVLFALAYLLSPLFGKDRQAAGVCRFLIVFGNVGFMGFPVIAALYGSGAVVIAAIYLIPFNLLAYSVGILMLTGGQGGIRWREMLNPAMAASILSLFFLFFHVRLPSVLTEALDTLGSMTVPGAMLVIGVTLGGASLKAIFADKHVYAVCFVRLILSPLAMWLAVRFILLPLVPIDPVYLDMLVVLSAMPSASMTTMLCLEYGIDPQLASSGVFLTTVLSIATVPMMVSLLLL